MGDAPRTLRARVTGQLLTLDEPVGGRHGRHQRTGGQRRRENRERAPHSPDLTASSN